MVSVKLSSRDIRRRFARYADVADRAIVKTMNEVVYLGKREFEQIMEEQFEGGVVPFTKMGIRYKKARAEDKSAFVYVAKNRQYIIDAMDGVDVRPKKSGQRNILEPKKGLKRTKKGLNIPNQYVQKRKLQTDKFFIGHPKGLPKTDENYGLWERLGRKGKRGGIARKQIKQRVNIGKTVSRRGKPVFNGRKMLYEFAITASGHRLMRNLEYYKTLQHIIKA